MVYHTYTMKGQTSYGAHFHGIIPPLVTPFDTRGNVDEPGLRAVVRHVLSGGVHGVFVAGSTSESYAMDDAQRIRALEIALDEVDGSVPVFLGTGRITTRATVKLTQAAAAAGASAASVVTPFFVSPSQDELYDHYRTVAAAVDIPLILYNNPGRTGVVLEPETIGRLAAIDNVVGMKDTAGNMGKIVDTIRLCPPGFDLFCGFDMIIFPTLAAGGAGAVPASANLAPRLIVRLYDSFRAGRLEESRRLQEMLAPLRKAFTLASFPAVLKEGLNLLGVTVGDPVLPIRPVTSEARKMLRDVLESLELNIVRPN